MAVSLRAADAADSDAIAALIAASKREVMPWLAVVHTPDEDRWWVREVLLSGHDVRVAVEPGRGGIVGVAAVRPGWIDQLYVAPGAQSRGVGRMLLDWAVGAAGDHAVDEVQLWTFQRNARARAFYERHGFVLEELTDGDGNEEGEPDARYRRADERLNRPV